MSGIRTPDQRLRVFISSTIEELKEERLLVREAIEALRLTPVFFEAGARPHPPRELYRAYLEQSDVFVGIYAGSYGWVAPDMTISGLEDEYRLSSGRPRLLYVREMSGSRDQRLTALLKEIEVAGDVSYKRFTTPEQLAELLKNDLAILLSERFGAHAAHPRSQHHGLPAMRGVTIGRDQQRGEIAERLLDPEVGLLTLTGPGGTGKSHLALRVAHDIQDRFADGVYFVPLASVQAAAQVLPAVAGALCLVDAGGEDLLDRLAEQLHDHDALVLVDNFEHVLEAAPLVAKLLARLPRIKWLVTSRSPLHLSGEHIYPVPPLDAPSKEDSGTELLLRSPAVQLFIRRAEARAASLVLDDANLMAIASLCRRLDGLPLAIELAAAHTKYFTPVALADRLDRSLDLLQRGPRDLPERQRTMRAAIAASYDLLDTAHQAFFRRLSVFSERWTIDGAAQVADAKALCLDPLEALEQLSDMGLVRVAQAQPHDPEEGPRFTMLHVVREFAQEEMTAHDERTAAMERLLAMCMVLAGESAQHVQSDSVFLWMDRLSVAYPDYRTVMRDALERGDHMVVWQLVAQLNTFWLFRGYRGEAMDWLRQTGFQRLLDDPGSFAHVPGILRAGVLLAAGAMSYYSEHQALSINYLHRAEQAFIEAGAPLMMRFYPIMFRGLAHIGHDDPDAMSCFDEMLRIAKELGNPVLDALARCYRNEIYLRRGEMDLAAADLEIAGRVVESRGTQLLRSSYHLIRGNLALVNGRIDEAVEHYRISADITRVTRIIGTLGWTMNGLGYGLLLQGRTDEARDVFTEGLLLARQGGYKAAIMACWTGLAWLAGLDGDALRGARILGATVALREQIEYSPWLAMRLEFEHARSAIAAGLDPGAMEREMAIGAALPHEEVHALALRSSSVSHVP